MLQKGGVMIRSEDPKGSQEGIQNIWIKLEPEDKEASAAHVENTLQQTW